MATLLRIKFRSGRWPQREKAMKVLVTGATGTVGGGCLHASYSINAQANNKFLSHGGYRHV